MIIGTARISLRANWVHSLKEKRMIVNRLIDRVKHRFNVSIAEIEHQDIHQSIVIGIACVSNNTKHANSMIDHVIDFIEQNTDAVVENINVDII